MPTPTREAVTYANPEDALEPSEIADLQVLTQMATLVTGLPNAFVTLADPAKPPIRGQESSYCNAALHEDDMLVVEDVRLDERTRAIAARRTHSTIVTYAGALIKTEDGRKLGTLCITDDVRRPLNTEQLQLLRSLARQAMNLLSLRQTKKDLTAALESMTRLATVDDLTGLQNRRAFMQEAEKMQKLVARRAGELCVAILDVDHFKKVNDQHGHAAGDRVLKDVAQALRAGLRESDLIGRIGGEEFAVVMPFTHAADAHRRLDQLRLRVAAQRGAGVTVTISGGLADVPAGTSIGEALKRADAALYRAKAGGRNQIETATELLPAAMEPLAA
ncbi:MAG: sensor domain-containing diguanylate cyclase [Paucibacter sp.]|nr:sensor domain-containing diguanylate cyclase [Roseateles sp.]